MASNWTRHPFVVTHKSPPQLLILAPAHCNSSPAHLHPVLPCHRVTMMWQQLKQHQFQRILGGQLLGLLIFGNCGPPTADRFVTPLTVLHTCVFAPTSNMTIGWASLCLKSEEKMGSHTHHQHFVCCGIQRYARDLKPELNFFKHPQFTGFQHTLDAEINGCAAQDLEWKSIIRLSLYLSQMKIPLR